VTTNDASLAHELRLIRNHGAETSASAREVIPAGYGETSSAPAPGGKYLHKRVGANFRLDAIQAPRRELEQRKKEVADAAATRDKIRMTNKAAFRP